MRPVEKRAPWLRYRELASNDGGKKSAVIRNGVIVARSVQMQCFLKTKTQASVQMGAKKIKRYCAVKADTEKLPET